MRWPPDILHGLRVQHGVQAPGRPLDEVAQGPASLAPTLREGLLGGVLTPTLSHIQCPRVFTVSTLPQSLHFPEPPASSSCGLLHSLGGRGASLFLFLSGNITLVLLTHSRQGPPRPTVSPGPQSLQPTLAGQLLAFVLCLQRKRAAGSG